MPRFLRIVLEIIAGLVGVFIVCAFLLVWRLNVGPMRSSFLTPYIEEGVDSFISGTHTSIAHSLLTWSNVDHSVDLKADGVKISDKDGTLIAEIPRMDIELSLFGLVLGQFLPTSFIVDHPQIKLKRSVEGDFYFGDFKEAAPEGQGDVKSVLTHIVDNLAHAPLTHKLQVSRFVVDVHDEATQGDWAVGIPEIALERLDGILDGHAIIDVTQKDHASSVDLHYTYSRDRLSHQIVTRFSDITPSFFVGGHPAVLGLAQASIVDLPLTGEISFVFDNDLTLASGAVQIHGDEGFLRDDDLWDKPRRIKSFELKADYDRKTQKLNVPLATVDFGGPRMGLTVTGVPSAQKGKDLDFNLSMTADHWPMDDTDSLWPKLMIPDVRAWIVSSLLKGTFDHAEIAVKGSLAWNDLLNAQLATGTGKILASGGRIDYLEGMPAVDGVSAEASFDLDQMKIQILTGGVATSKLMPSTIQITGLRDEDQYIDIPLKIVGPIPDVLTILDSPRLGYTKELGLARDDIHGKVDGLVDLHFPLLKSLAMKDVGIKAHASLSAVESSKLVQGINIAQGSMVLDLDKKGFSVKGPATLNGVPFGVVWQQNFDETVKPQQKGNIVGIVRDDQWDSLGVHAFKGTRGPVNLAIQITRPNRDKTILEGNLDMTAAAVQMPQLNWKKPAGAQAALKFVAELPKNNNINVKSFDLQAVQTAAKGTAVLSPDAGEIIELDANPLIVGRTNAVVHLGQAKDASHRLLFTATGTSLDITGLKDGNEQAPADTRPKEYRLRIGTLYTGDKGFITNAEGYAIRDQQGWNEIGLHGLAEGTHPLDISLDVKAGGRRVFQVLCDDFGKALQGMGFTDTVRDGDLKIHGESTPENSRLIQGTVKIGSFTVKDLPVLALLLNAASPFGFIGILTDSADFSSLSGKFRWEGDKIELIKLRAAGSAVGINVDGHVDMNSGDAHLYGTLVPFSVMNSLINYLPLIGGVITGGEGQGVLAVAYKITGSLAKPKVSVNPSSLLTPGFIRNLFFGGEDSEDELHEQEDKTAQ